MKFFLDTANVEAIQEADEMGLLDGVTTNPTIIYRENKPFEKVIKEIAEILGDRPLNVELISEEPEEALKEANKYLKIVDGLVMKVPITNNGLKIIKRLTDEGISANTTLVFSPLQALLASKAGADYVSPFVGRLDDISHYGMDLIAQIVEIFYNYSIETEVIVASIRNPLHVLESARLGADIATIPPSVIEKLSEHPLTRKGIKKFLEDYNKLEKA
jgi:transaldolase